MTESERLQELRRQHVRRQSAQAVNERRIRRLLPNLRRGSAAECLLQAGLPPFVLLWLGVACVVAGGFLYACYGIFGRATTVFLLPAIVYTCAIPPVEFRRSERRRQAASQLPRVLREVAGLLRAGQSLEVALGRVAIEAQPGVLQAELAIVHELLELHVPVEAACHGLVRRVCGAEMESFSLCLQLGAHHPSQLVTSLEDCATRIERQGMQLESRRRAFQMFQPTSHVLLSLSCVVLLALAASCPDWVMNHSALSGIIRCVMVGQVTLMAALLRLMLVEEE